MCVTLDCGFKPSRIVGGSEVTPFSLPWQVALVDPGDDLPFCGGTLISATHVLTAAHCTGGNGGNWEVIVGEHDITSTSDGTRHTKCSHVNHPQYDDTDTGTEEFNFDFAIVKLNTPVEIGPHAAPACLPTPKLEGDFLSGKTMTVSGWGALSQGGDGPFVLHKVEVPGLTNEVCQEKYECPNDGGICGELIPAMLCAGNVVDGGIDSCQGDSGGT